MINFHRFKRIFSKADNILQIHLKFIVGNVIQDSQLCENNLLYRKQMSIMCDKTDSIDEKLNYQQEGILDPPVTVLGMKVLDRDKFKKEIEVPSLSVSVDKVKLTIKNLKPYFLKMRKLQPVIDDNNHKLVLLNPVLVNENISKIEEILKSMSLQNLSSTKIPLCYENWSHENVFKAVLPQDYGGSISSFSIIGHIIHLNLKPHLMDYKCLIGQVLLDKFINAKTVVNKTQEIGTEFRNFSMEVLAGESNFSVLVKENGHQYAFDFSKVFWNPRLVNEHNQIVKKINRGDLVYDVFAGVGPFAIPASKKRCYVHANDLNPDSYQWLCHNSKLNKVDDCLKAYNLDGRDFILDVIKKGLVEHWSKSNDNTVHIIMNLPASALEFFSLFQGLLNEEDMQLDLNMPIIYCYCFLKKGDEIGTLIKKYIDADLHENLKVTPVRLVAPNKTMIRIECTLTRKFLLCMNEEPQTKKN